MVIFPPPHSQNSLRRNKLRQDIKTWPLTLSGLAVEIKYRKGKAALKAFWLTLGFWGAPFSLLGSGSLPPWLKFRLSLLLFPQHTYSGIWQRKAVFTWCRTPKTGFPPGRRLWGSCTQQHPSWESCILLEGDELGPVWPPSHSAHRNTAQDCPVRKLQDSVGFSHFPFSELSFEQKLNKSPKLRGETQKTLTGFSNPCLK